MKTANMRIQLQCDPFHYAQMLFGKSMSGGCAPLRVKRGGGSLSEFSIKQHIKLN